MTIQQALSIFEKQNYLAFFSSGSLLYEDGFNER